MPCGECTACCTASQFVHIGPDERDALSVIPPEVLFPAPGFPAGHVLMGYDDQGCCPMFDGNGCSIYEHRPRTCRTYDCRVFAATAVVPEDPEIAARVTRWRFDYGTDEALRTQEHLKQRAAADDDSNQTRRAVKAVSG